MELRMRSLTCIYYILNPATHLLARTTTERCLPSGWICWQNNLEAQNPRRDTSIPRVSTGLVKGSQAWWKARFTSWLKHSALKCFLVCAFSGGIFCLACSGASGGISFWCLMFLLVILVWAVSGVKYFCGLQRLSGVLGRGFDVLL